MQLSDYPIRAAHTHSWARGVPAAAVCVCYSLRRRAVTGHEGGPRRVPTYILCVFLIKALPGWESAESREPSSSHFFLSAVKTRGSMGRHGVGAVVMVSLIRAAIGWRARLRSTLYLTGWRRRK